MSRYLALVLILAGCTLPATSPGSTTGDIPPETTGESSAQPVEGTTTTTAAPTIETFVATDYELISCAGSPPVAFAVLCDAYEDLDQIYVDEIDPAGLAAAAVIGLADVPADEDPPAAPAVLRCAVPDPAFEQLCERLSGRLVEDAASVESLMEGAVRGMFRYGLDPFSVYVPGSIVDADIDLSGLILELGLTVGARDGSGAVCTPIGEGCELTALSVFDFGAARNAGMAGGDVITAIDGEPVEGLSGEEAIALLSGAPGTSVALLVDRNGLSNDRTLVREDIRFDPIEFEMIEDVAYIRLNDFSQPAAQGLGSVLQDDEVRSALGIVLDMRDNPGGLLLAAQAVASQFLDGGLVMLESGRDWENEVPVVEGGLATTGPQMVVLVNRATASSAEVVAAVLQERQRAVVVGEPTFGKNLVQLVDRSRDGGQIRITVARWSTPGDLDIGLTGLEPDILVEVPPDTVGDPVLETALGLLGG